MGSELTDGDPNLTTHTIQTTAFADYTPDKDGSGLVSPAVPVYMTEECVCMRSFSASCYKETCFECVMLCLMISRVSLLVAVSWKLVVDFHLEANFVS